MSTAVDTTTDIRTFRIDIADEQIDDLRRRIAATRWPSKELVEDRSQGVQLATMQGARALLGDRLRLARVEAQAERAAAVHDRDRRGGHPLHPRAVAARGRAAADHDARLARLGHRAARDRRPAHRPDRARRRPPRTPSTSCCPSMPGYGFSGEPTELGWDAGRVARALGGADAPPRLHPLRRPGRRRGRRRHRRDGPPGARGAARHPHQPARGGARGAPPADGVRRRNARRTTRSTRSRRTAPATSWRWPRGRRRSATPCWIHPSPWRPGCSTTTPTATTRSPARSSTGSPRAISPGTTSSTTSRCTG